RTPVDRSAGDTSRTAGVLCGVGDVVGSDRELLTPADPSPSTAPWQALSASSTAAKPSTVAQPWPRWALAAVLNVSNRLSGQGLWPIALPHRPGGAAMLTDAVTPQAALSRTRDAKRRFLHESTRMC